jgi:hypothetical protein
MRQIHRIMDATVREAQRRWRPKKRHRPKGIPRKERKYTRRRDDPAYIAERILFTHRLEPWKVYYEDRPREHVPHKNVLQRWLRIARELAWRRWGTKDVCHICFRPLRVVGEPVGS